jgi:hypothetical protein
MRKFPLGQVVEDIVDLLVGINAMRMFDHPLKRGNHFDAFGETEIFTPLSIKSFPFSG